MLEYVDSDLYIVKDKNNFINPLLQVGSESGSVEKVPDPAGQKSPNPDPHHCKKHREPTLFGSLRPSLTRVTYLEYI